MPTILVIGTGFAGLWSAMSARRLINLRGKDNVIEVIVLAPEASLVLRPRLYEANAAGMKAELHELFQVIGVRFVQGTVKSIQAAEHAVYYLTDEGVEASLTYDRLVLAAGSRLSRPASVPGLADYAFDIDDIKAATKLETHLHHLASLPPSSARDTVVVCGAGFTGIEMAAELPARLGSILGKEARPRVILIDNATDVGPELGPGPRPVITEALEELGVEVKLGTAVAGVTADGVVLASGERIDSLTAIWTAGVAATPLTQQIDGDKDSFGRLRVDADLRVPSAKEVFATGDAACARTDDSGERHTMMSCQHAMLLGRASGNNAAADLLGEPTFPYSQPSYGTCLDLGAYGAVITQGWEREVMAKGAVAKPIKNYVNQTLIYPPKADMTEAFASADPNAPDPIDLLSSMLAA